MVSPAYARRVKMSAAVDTTRLRPFADPLPIPQRRSLDSPVTIRLVEAPAHVFHQQLAPTRVWAYDPRLDDLGRVRPLVLEATAGRTARVQWRNALPSGRGTLRPFLDLGIAMSGAAGHPGMDPYAIGSATTHLHGGHLPWRSDGHPVRIPGAVTVTAPGHDKRCTYPNTQPAATLWFHDHVMGATAANVYAGLVGMYLLRWTGPGPDPDAEQDGAGGNTADGNAAADERALGLPMDPPGAEFDQEMPLILGDRSFTADGTVIYGATFPPPDPASPARAADQASEFKGDTVVVNGAVWPFREVAPDRYRFRVVNAASSRFFRLVLRDDRTGSAARTPDEVVTGDEVTVMTQIGGDGGFLPAPFPVGPGRAVVLAPGERADLVIDFTGLAGRDLVLCNDITAESDVGSPVLEGNGGDLTLRPDPTDPTGRPQRLPAGLVLQFRVRGPDPTPPRPRPHLAGQAAEVAAALAALRTAATTPAPAGVSGPTPTVATRTLLLREIDPPTGPALPQIADVPTGTALGWYTPRTGPPAESAALGSVEIWEFLNTSPDTHPIHLHLVQFLVLDRRPISATGSAGAIAPDPNELGWKDTVRMATGHITRIAVRFTGWRGRYVWHCHILEHEDMGMMRPLVVT